MPEKRDYRDYITDIWNQINKIEEFTRDFTYKDFAKVIRKIKKY
jgi:uncharacterized protein with HEPN domain